MEKVDASTIERFWCMKRFKSNQDLWISWYYLTNRQRSRRILLLHRLVNRVTPSYLIDRHHLGAVNPEEAPPNIGKMKIVGDVSVGEVIVGYPIVGDVNRINFFHCSWRLLSGRSLTLRVPSWYSHSAILILDCPPPSDIHTKIIIPVFTLVLYPPR